MRFFQFLGLALLLMLKFPVLAQMPGFVIKNEKEIPIKLDKVVKNNKYTLVDFWASWCAPCRVQAKELKEFYPEFKDKGFEVVGISIDTKKDAWNRAVAVDRNPWIQLSELKGLKSDIAIFYKVKMVPQTVLLDKKGQIVAIGLHGRELKRKLGELFKN